MMDRPEPIPPPESAAATPPAEQGVSLDQLAAAFARLLGEQNASSAETPALPAPVDAGHSATPDTTARAVESQAAESRAGQATSGGPSSPPDAPSIDSAREPSAEAAGDAVPITPLGILEALLFVGHPENQPLSAEQAASIMRGVSADEVHQLVVFLNERYDQLGRAFRIEAEGGGYRLVLRPELAAVKSRYLVRTRQTRLSQTAIDVLAVVAYNQPLTADEVSRLRGHPSRAVLDQLVRRQLLALEHPRELLPAGAELVEHPPGGASPSAASATPGSPGTAPTENRARKGRGKATSGAKSADEGAASGPLPPPKASTRGTSRAGLYTTTPRFLELFGLNRLEDLPKSQDIELR